MKSFSECFGWGNFLPHPKRSVYRFGISSRRPVFSFQTHSDLEFSGWPPCLYSPFSPDGDVALPSDFLIFISSFGADILYILSKNGGLRWLLVLLSMQNPFESLEAINKKSTYWVRLHRHLQYIINRHYLLDANLKELSHT